MLSDLPDEILASEIFPHLDASTFQSIIEVDKRFNRLSQAQAPWQSMIKQYYPYLRALFPKRYLTDAQNLFFGEIGYFDEFLDAYFMGPLTEVDVSDIRQKHIFAAMEGQTQFLDEVMHPQHRIILIIIMLARGHQFILDDPKIIAIINKLSTIDEDVSYPLEECLICAIDMAAWFGHETGVQVLVPRFLQELDSTTWCEQAKRNELQHMHFSALEQALRNGQVGVARNFYNKHIKALKLDPEILKTELRIVFEQIFTFSHDLSSVRARSCWLTSLEFLCAIEQGIDSSGYYDNLLDDALNFIAEHVGKVEILDKLIELKLKSMGKANEEIPALNKRLLMRALKGNNAAVFIHLYQPQKLLHLYQKRDPQRLLRIAIRNKHSDAIVKFLAGRSQDPVLFSGGPNKDARLPEPVEVKADHEKSADEQMNKRLNR